MAATCIGALTYVPSAIGGAVGEGVAAVEGGEVGARVNAAVGGATVALGVPGAAEEQAPRSVTTAAIVAIRVITVGSWALGWAIS
jgi:hypothetical protein